MKITITCSRKDYSTVLKDIFHDAVYTPRLEMHALCIMSGCVAVCKLTQSVCGKLRRGRSKCSGDPLSHCAILLYSEWDG